MNNRYSFIEADHIHTLDGKPLIGTSTALSVLAKPLTWWASGLAVAELGWTPINGKDKKAIPFEQRLPTASERFNEIKNLSPEEYLKLLDKAYRAHSTNLKKTATAGTDMHAELEKYVKRMITDQAGKPIPMNGYEHKAVELFADWAVKNVEQFLVSEAHCYSEELWTGGIVDLIYEDTQGRLIIMDFKSSKDAYLSQFFQDAGYDIAISENGALDKDGNLILKLERSADGYAVFPFGMENPEPQFHFDTEGAKKGFKASVCLHRLLN